MDDVRLPDLEVIRRYSIAVRRERAPVEEVIAALRADLERLAGGGKRTRPAETAGRPLKEVPTARTAAKPSPSAAARTQQRKPAKPAPRRAPKR